MAFATVCAANDPTDVVSMFERTREEGFGAEVKQRIMIGTYALSAGYYDAYYLKAQKVRTLLRRDFEKAFEEFDVLITPTSPTVAFGIGELADDPLAMKLADVCTIPVNLAGIPALSIPCGFKNGLPIGLQIMGQRPRRGNAYPSGIHIRAAHRLSPRKALGSNGATGTGVWKSPFHHPTPIPDTQSEIMMEYEPVIGMEVHVELQTASKMFCGCEVAFGGDPNTRCCPVCLGLPGSLPVVNERAIELMAEAALALGCTCRAAVDFPQKELLLPGPAQELSGFAV